MSDWNIDEAFWPGPYQQEEAVTPPVYAVPLNPIRPLSYTSFSAREPIQLEAEVSKTKWTELRIGTLVCLDSANPTPIGIITDIGKDLNKFGDECYRVRIRTH